MKNIRFRSGKKNYGVSEKNKIIKILSAVTAVVILILFTGNSWKMFQERQAATAFLKEQESQEVSVADSGEDEKEFSEESRLQENRSTQVPETVVRDGIKYKRNPAIRTILFLGVDKKDTFPDSYLPAYGGQSDAIFLLIQNTSTKKVQILQIPRETMTKIRLYDLGGQFISWETRQITLAFAYGSTPVMSSENVAAAISELLEGIHVDDYMAITMGAIPVLNDQVGGVTVKIDDPVLEEADPAFVHGTDVTLNAELAEKFLRKRDMNATGAAYSRMIRHRQYLEAWFLAAQKAAAADNSFGAKMMSEMSPYMATDMPKDRYLKLGLDILQNQGIPSGDDILTIPGEVVRGTYFDEFHYDQDKLHEMILDLFYRKAG